MHWENFGFLLMAYLCLPKYPTISLFPFLSFTLTLSSAFISCCACILAMVQEEEKRGEWPKEKKYRAEAWECVREGKKGERKKRGVSMRRERPSMTKAVGPQLWADLQRGLQRVRYLTQLALHSSLSASLSPPHLSFLLPPFLSWGAPTSPLCPSFLLSFPSLSLQKHAS